MPAVRIFLLLIADFVVFLGLLIRPRKTIAAENSSYVGSSHCTESAKCRPRRIDPATRMKTLIGWHRAGFRFFWRWKSKPGRPPIPTELQRLIREMARDNPLSTKPLTQ
jgi:putative transposase